MRCLKLVGEGTSDLQFGELRRNGEKDPVWLGITLSPIRCTPDENRLIMCRVEDVTTRRLDTENLVTAKEEAERATQTKSDFLANMSHEIRTPIHTITGMTELLRETILDAEQNEYANQIGFSADVLLSLINDILDFSKIEAGKLSLEEIEFDLYNTVEGAVDLVAMEAHKKGLEVILDMEKGVPRYVVGDPVRVRQIITNLFNNAMKFTQTGEIGIKLELMYLIDAQAEVKITVRDTGIGIPKSRTERLFRVFSQVDSSTTRKYGGSGLGLSICKNLVAMMNGSIGVDSEEGRGSQFWFKLPFSLTENETKRRPPEKLFEPTLRALVVDDNPTARKITMSYLAEWGIEANGSGGGEEALLTLRNATRVENPFHICIVDLLMPKIDGWHFASEIHADGSIGELKLFLMSPTGKSGDEAKMKLLNWFEGYVNKPVKKDEIYGMLANSLLSAEELEPVGETVREEEGFSFSNTQGTILVAEDHEVNQQLFRTILQNLGLQVVLASNGREAVERATSEVSLIFMDVQMPEMSGYEATEALRKKGFEAPIVAVTASAVKGEREQAEQSGMTDFLTKPFKKQDLIPILKKWLVSRHEDAGAPEDTESDSEPTDMEELGDTTENDKEVFDFDEAVDTFMGDQETVKKLLGVLITKTQKCLHEIQQGLDNGDIAAVRSAAHSVKGSSWNLSAKKMGDVAAILENAAKDGKESVAKDTYHRLSAAFEEFVTHTKKFGDARSGAGTDARSGA